MARRGKWQASDVTNGFGEIRFLRWRYFTDYINQHMLDYDAYVWRGQQREDWKLEPTLDRLIREEKVASRKKSTFRSAHLDRFKFAARGRRGSNPPAIDDENEWWALGQHHGLATPLLDWTASPFAAAYFALIANDRPTTKYRAVYALHRPSIERRVKDLVNKRKEGNARKLADIAKAGSVNNLAKSLLTMEPRPQVEFIKPKSDENQRLVSQNALFTRAPIATNLEDWVTTNFADDTGYTLMKLLIPNKDREEGLRMLNRMNINHVTLFPDLYGSSKFCNLFAQIDSY